MSIYQNIYRDGPVIENTLAAAIINNHYELKQVKTQKAKGLVTATWKLSQYYSKYSLNMLPDYTLFSIFKNEKDIDRLLKWGFEFLVANAYRSPGKGLFVRPCPTTPKHGFVESRIVKSEKQLREVWQETITADPNGELILCEPIMANFNAVLTPNSITIGKGHDGATSGKGVVVLPVSGDLLPHKVDSKTGESIKTQLGIDNTPYIELVYAPKPDEYNLSTAVVTQLRDGPEIKTLRDIIKQDCVVEEIIEVDKTLLNDPLALLKWDQLITSLEGKTGVVVYHNGGSPTCHFGVHCDIHHIPYITTFKPVVGQHIKVTSEQKIDYAQVREGLILGLSKDYSTMLEDLIQTDGNYNQGYNTFQKMLVGSLYALHGSALLGTAESKFLGFAVANLIRLATGACLGELRHFKPIAVREGKKERSSVYKKYITDIEQGLTKLRFAHAIFDQGHWGGSFGGKAWANCTELTIELVNAVLKFYHRSKDKNLDLPGVQSAVDKLFMGVRSKFNELVNAVHNGGLFLDKFGQRKFFDTAAENLAMFAGMAGAELYQQFMFVENCEPASRKICREKLISSKLYRKEKKIVDALVRETYCGNCGQSVCGCVYCDNCESYDCSCDTDREEETCNCSQCMQGKNERERIRA